MKRNFTLAGIVCVGAKRSRRGKGAEQGGGRGPGAGVWPCRSQQPSECGSSGLDLEVLMDRGLLFTETLMHPLPTTSRTLESLGPGGIRANHQHQYEVPIHLPPLGVESADLNDSLWPQSPYL